MFEFQSNNMIMSMLLAAHLVGKWYVWSLNTWFVVEQQVLYKLFVFTTVQNIGGTKRVLGGLGMIGSATVRVVISVDSASIIISGITMKVVIGGATTRVVGGGVTAKVVVGVVAVRVVVGGLIWICVDLWLMQTWSRWLLIITTEVGGYFRTSNVVIYGIDARNLVSYAWYKFDKFIEPNAAYRNTIYRTIMAWGALGTTVSAMFWITCSACA